MQGNKAKPTKKLASVPSYVSPNQLSIDGFETTFERKLNADNRWVLLSKLIPWDEIVAVYNGSFVSKEGRPPINGRVIIGAMLIKHLCNFTDRETIENIAENVYMQYFLGYSSFTNEAPFTAPLFVTIRERLSMESLSRINDIVAKFYFEKTESNGDTSSNSNEENNSDNSISTASTDADERQGVVKQDGTEPALPNKGKLLMDATIAPQNITFPTDLKLLNSAREKSEQLIDLLYDKEIHGAVKPRTYRNEARKRYLNTSKKKRKTVKELYKAIGQQLRYLKRNLAHISNLLNEYDEFPLTHRDQKYLLVLNTVYEQQHTMYTTRVKSIAHRIVNIHQPHVRPMVRGKDGVNVEFGSKLQMSLVAGFVFLDKLSWEAFNEGTCLIQSVESYKNRLGFYPAEVLADQIYANKANRAWLKEKGIKLSAKKLGRPSKEAVADHISPGERNPIEGKFGQGKVAYGLNNIKAKLKSTSESWVACIALVLNLVNLTRQALVYVYQKLIQIIITQICFCLRLRVI